MSVGPNRICYTCGRSIACRVGEFEPPDGSPTIWFCREHGEPIVLAALSSPVGSLFCYPRIDGKLVCYVPLASDLGMKVT